jgi:hypothetical protein
MPSSLNSILPSKPTPHAKLGAIRRKLAKAMVGCTVDLLADGSTVAHGIVTGVLVVAGATKIVVNGRAYDVDRVVTATAL